MFYFTCDRSFTDAQRALAWRAANAPVPALHSARALGLLRASGRMLTNELTNRQTRRIAIPPGGGSKSNVNALD